MGYIYFLSVCFWLQALTNIVKQKDMESDPENVIGYLRPFRIIISLLDKPEIGRQHCEHRTYSIHAKMLKFTYLTQLDLDPKKSVEFNLEYIWKRWHFVFISRSFVNKRPTYYYFTQLYIYVTLSSGLFRTEFCPHVNYWRNSKFDLWPLFAKICSFHPWIQANVWAKLIVFVKLIYRYCMFS